MTTIKEKAMAAYRRGALEEAITLQRQLVSDKSGHKRRKSGLSPSAEDFLFLSFLLHSDKQLPVAIETLRDGVRHHPKSPELHENLGVCLLAQRDVTGATEELQQALKLGSKSVNTLDSLCHALASVGRVDEGMKFGRQSLETKDKLFGGSKPLIKVPAGAPPVFNSGKRKENIIAYSLWGANPRYLMPLLENLRIRNHLFPAWTIRIYVDKSVPEARRQQLQTGGAQLVLMKQPADEPPARRLLWRFEVIADPEVKRFLIRDADSLLTVKERVAVDDWLQSPKYFHLMRDFYTHTDLMLAGLWGGVGGVLPPVKTLLEHFKPWRLENDHVDQDLLGTTVWPMIRRSCLIHDSVFTGCLGSVPFPPFGELPRRHHVGQNAFIHFRESKGKERA